MSDAMDKIKEQIEQARQAGASAGSEVATTPSIGTGVATVQQVAEGKPVSLTELLDQGGLSVDAYLKVKEAGILIGSDSLNYIEEIPVEFRLSDVVPFFSVRWGQQPAKYARSYDRRVEAKSKRPWATVVAEAQAQDPRCKGDYPTSEIPFVVCEDIVATKGDKKGQPLIEAGQTAGLTLSITGFREFKAFIKPFNDLKNAGQLPADLLLRGKLVHSQRKSGNDTWGVVTYVDFVPIEDADATVPASERD